MKITEAIIIDYLALLKTNMKAKRIEIPVETRNFSYTKNNSIMDVVCCLKADDIKESIRNKRRVAPNTQLETEPELLEPIAINHIELEVSYMTKKAIFGAVPNADEMRLINSFLKGLGIESDRAFIRSLKD